MWCEGQHDDERLPRKRGTPRSHPSDGYHRVLNIVPRQPPPLGRKPSLLKNPPLLGKKPPLLGRPGEGNYNRYYSLDGCQDYDKCLSFSHDRRSGPTQRGDKCEYQCSRYSHSATHQIDYRDLGPSSHCMRDQFPHKRNPTFFGRSPVGPKFYLHSRFVPNVGNRSYSPVQNKFSSFQHFQHRSKQQDEIFVMVEKKSIEKGPFLDKSIRFALSQNLPEVGVQCVGEQLKHSISEYDTSTQDFERHDMWSERQYDCERIYRDQVLPQSHPSDDYHRALNIVPGKIPLLGRKAPLLEKKTPLLEKKLPLLEKKPPLLERPGKGSYNEYYSLTGYQEYDKGCTVSYDRRSVPPQKGHGSGYQWSRYNHSASYENYYRDKRDSYRRKRFYSSHYMKDQFPHTKDPTFFGESLLDQKDSSVSNRKHSRVQEKTHSFQQSQHRSNERKVQSLKTSRYTPLSSSEAAPSSKVLDKPRRLTEEELEEAVRRWAAKNSEKSEESKLSGISEFKVVPTTPLFSKQTEAPGTDTADSTEACEDNQRSSRLKSIASKAKEVKQVYQQYSKTFGMVVKMLIQKDPSLEKAIQFALRQNLREIGEQCVRELEEFIAEYDASKI